MAARATAAVRCPTELPPEIGINAAKPAAPALRALIDVHVAQRAYGRRKSRRRPEAPTSIAANGPYATAENRIGSAETATSVLEVNRTERASAQMASPARIARLHAGAFTPYPTLRRIVARSAAPVASAAAQSVVREGRSTHARITGRKP
jgi:hypothetical protein